MKRLLILLAALSLLLVGLVGCSKENKSDEAKLYKDGVYKAQVTEDVAENSHGWTDFVEITIKDGKIKDVVSDSINKDGVLKTQDPTYVMDPPPSQWHYDLADSLVETQDVDKVEDIVGATHSSKNFKKLSKVALENAKTGDTELAKVNTTDMNE